MLKNLYSTMSLWEAWNQPCSSSHIFVQSADTLHNSTERVHLLCTKPNHARLSVFAALWQRNNETTNNSSDWDETGRWCIHGDSVRICSKWSMLALFRSGHSLKKMTPLALSIFFSLLPQLKAGGRHHVDSTFSLANSGMTGFLCQLQLWMTAFYLPPAN